MTDTLIELLAKLADDKAVDPAYAKDDFFSGAEIIARRQLAQRAYEIVKQREIPVVNEKEVRKSIASELTRCAESAESHDWNNQTHRQRMVNAIILALRPYLREPKREVQPSKILGDELWECKVANGEIAMLYVKALEEIEALKAVTQPVREVVNQEARELIEILHGALLGLQSMSSETEKPRFDEYINLGRDFLLRNSTEAASSAREIGNPNYYQQAKNLALENSQLRGLNDALRFELSAHRAVTDAARELVRLMDDLPEEPGGQQDRVFAEFEFDKLRYAFTLVDGLTGTATTEIEDGQS